MLSIIVAMDTNNLIGNNNALPWHLPADMKFFKETTSAHNVIMGRKTYESIGKPLPNRSNIILTRDKNYHVEGCDILHELSDIHAMVDTTIHDAFIIGGSTLYEQTLDMVKKLYITRIHHEFSGDAYFPTLGDEWKLHSQQHHTKDDKNKYDYTFQTFVKHT